MGDIFLLGQNQCHITGVNKSNFGLTFHLAQKKFTSGRWCWVKSDFSVSLCPFLNFQTQRHKRDTSSTHRHKMDTFLTHRHKMETELDNLLLVGDFCLKKVRHITIPLSKGRNLVFVNWGKPQLFFNFKGGLLSPLIPKNWKIKGVYLLNFFPKMLHSKNSVFKGA